MKASPRTQRELAIVVGRFLKRHGYSIGKVPGSSQQLEQGIFVHLAPNGPGHVVMMLERRGKNYLATYLHFPPDEVLFDRRSQLMLQASEPDDYIELQVLAGMIAREIRRPVIVIDPYRNEPGSEIDQGARLDDQSPRKSPEK